MTNTKHYSLPGRLQNKSIIITGGGSGIGRACAIAFAMEAASVIIVDIDKHTAAETLQMFPSNMQNCYVVQADVGDPVAVQNIMQFAIDKLKKIDVLVNNAAIQVNKTIIDTTFEEWNRQMAVNLGGIFLCSKYAMPYLKMSGGTIVNMSSVNGFFTEASCAGYCATKAGIIGLTKAMAIDHGKDGVRVNCICPGYIDGGLAEGYFKSQSDPSMARKNAGKLHALGRIGLPEEVAKSAVFLASEDSSFITGATLTVDGGFSAGLPPTVD